MKPERLSHRKLIELRQLIARLCDDTLEPHESARLEELVCSDEACCDYYVTNMHIDATLPRYLGGVVPGAAALISEHSEQLASTSRESTENNPQVAAIASCTTDEVARGRKTHQSKTELVSIGTPVISSRTGNRFSHAFSYAGMAGAVMGALISVAAIFTLQRRAGENSPAPSADSHLVNETSGFPSFSSVQLQSGSVKLGIDKVGWVLVDGPTDFDLIGPMRARLNYGRIQMRVTERTGRGFIVETPDGEVTDLGTEFGLDVSRGGKTGLVVFEGAVDLRVANTEPANAQQAERLVGGEGVVFNKDGQSSRINSIVTGIASTFLCRDESLTGTSAPAILGVTDNLRASDTKSYYEIVAGGLRDDAKAYVDRPEHEWNGVTKQGLPTYLIGADYVKPFNADKLHSAIEISVTLGKPATLYIFFDDRVKKVPDWLKKNFRKTGDKIGLDGGEWSGSKIHSRRGSGPGVSIDERFSIWQRTVTVPGIVKLGPNTKNSATPSVGMYGIAAVALDRSASSKPASPSVTGVSASKSSNTE